MRVCGAVTQWDCNNSAKEGCGSKCTLIMCVIARVTGNWGREWHAAKDSNCMDVHLWEQLGAPIFSECVCVGVWETYLDRRTGSTPTVGSSRMRRSGFWSSAAPRDTLRFWPPLKTQKHKCHNKGKKNIGPQINFLPHSLLCVVVSSLWMPGWRVEGGGWQVGGWGGGDPQDKPAWQHRAKQQHLNNKWWKHVTFLWQSFHYFILMIIEIRAIKF